MSECAKLKEALEWALEYIDAIPSEIPLPVMPGFDRDYVNGLLEGKSIAYTVYYGMVHQTNEERQFALPKPRTAMQMLRILNRLNKTAHIYGITYYMKERTDET